MIIDIIIAAVLFLSALIAFFRGFVREVLTLCGFIGALIIAFFMAPQFQGITHGWFDVGEDDVLFGIIPTTVAIDVGTFSAIFLVALILLTLIAHAISHGLHAAGLGALDRTLGVLFGIMRGLFLILIFYLPFYFTASDGQKEEWFESSSTLPIVDLLAFTLEPYMPFGDSETEDTEEASQGFGRLDDVMRNALEPRPQDGDLTQDEPTQGGYDDINLDALNNIIRDNLNNQPSQSDAQTNAQGDEGQFNQ